MAALRLHLSRSVTFSIKMQGQCQQQLFLTQSAAQIGAASHTLIVVLSVYSQTAKVNLCVLLKVLHARTL
jgi:hypothetical protein